MAEHIATIDPVAGTIEPAPLTVGRIVHYYTKDTSKHANGQGNGPYPAIVLQTFNNGKMGNLKVLSWSGDYVVGSQQHYDDARKGLPEGTEPWAYWVWPPRV